MKVRVSLKEQLKNAVSVEGKISKRRLFAKLFVTLVASVWVLIFLGVALSLGDPLLGFFRDNNAKDVTIRVIAAWYMLTIVVSAVYLLNKVYGLMIGEWTTKDSDILDIDQKEIEKSLLRDIEKK